MKQSNSNEKINRDAERKEIESIVMKITARLKKCPPSVLQGSHNTAVAWKSAAKDAMQVSQSKALTLKKAQEAFAKLDAFYPSDFSLEAA